MADYMAPGTSGLPFFEPQSNVLATFELILPKTLGTNAKNIASPAGVEFKNRRFEDNPRHVILKNIRLVAGTCMTWAH